jgi:branched-chain amino acid transport system permease protein
MTKTRSLSLIGWTLTALVLGTLLSVFVKSDTMLSLLTQAITYAMLALGIGVLLRQNGVASFGHAAFYGSSSYVLAILLQTGATSAEAATLIAVVGVAVVAFILGLVFVRVPGIAFGMLTLAVGQMLYLTASRSRGLTGGTDGMNVAWPDRVWGFQLSHILIPAHIFMICWIALVLVVLALAILLSGRFGAVTEAIRDNEERARFLGIRTLLPRAAVFSLSAGIAALSGALTSLNTGFISPDNLHWSVSGVALMMVVVGGYSRLWGPPLGAIIYFLAKDLLGSYAEHWMAIFGIALIFTIIFSPRGLVGLFVRNKRGVFQARRPAEHQVFHESGPAGYASEKGESNNT